MSTRNVTTLVNRIDHDPNGVQTAFTYDFLVDDATWMFVYADGSPYTEPFSISGIGDPEGGEVTFDTAPDAGIDTLTLMREVPLTQLVVYPVYGPFPAKSHEGALDKLTFITQQLNEQLGRCWQAPIDGDESDLADHVESTGSEVHGLGNVDALSIEEDTSANDLSINGFRFADQYTGNVPAGTGPFDIFTLRSDSSNGSQISIDRTSGAVWVRTEVANVWSAWSRLTQGSTDLGTASLYDVTETPTDDTPTRILKVDDFGIGSQCVLVTDPNALSIDTTGFYYGSNFNDTPTNNPFFITHQRRGDQDAVQVAIDQVTGISYTRILDGTIWFDWVMNYNQTSAVLQPSWDGGKPTGGIVHNAYTEDGIYTWWADGSMIASGAKTCSSTQDTEFLFPWAFIVTPNITSAVLTSQVSTPYSDHMYNRSATGFSGNVVGVSGRVEAALSWIAHGRWY